MTGAAGGLRPFFNNGQWPLGPGRWFLGLGLGVGPAKGGFMPMANSLCVAICCTDR